MEGKVDREVGYRARGEDGPRADTGKKQNRRAPLSRLRPIEEGDFFIGASFSAVTQVGGRYITWTLFVLGDFYYTQTWARSKECEI